MVFPGKEMSSLSSPPCTQGGAVENFMTHKILFFILFILGTFGTAQAVILDRIVAVVNDEVITLSELHQAEVSFTREGKDPSKKDPEELLKTLIDKKVKLQKAKELGIKIPDNAVTAGIREIVQRNGLTEELLKEKIEKEGISWSDYKNRIREQMILSRMLNREVRSKIVLLPEDPKEYYREHQDRFARETKKHILRILLTLPEGATPDIIAARKEEMEKLRERIVGGGDFRQLAVRFSEGPESRDGGDLGDFSEGELRGDLNRATEGLKAGEITPVFQTREGITLLMVADVKTPAPVPFEEVKDAIKETVYQEKVRKRYESWLKELREGTYIEIKL